jgi:hypothetical protein
MPAAPRSQRIIAYHSTAGGNSGVWICPDNHITLVKSIHISNPTAAIGQMNVTVVTADGSVALTIPLANIAANTHVEWNGWIVLNPGDYILLTGVTAGLMGWVSAAVLGGPPLFPPVAELLPADEPNS